MKNAIAARSETTQCYVVLGQQFREEELTWALDNPVPGHHAKTTTIVWDFELRRGGRSTDPDNRRLLPLMMSLISSRAQEPSTGETPAPTTLTALAASLRSLMEWMLEEGFISFADVDPDASIRFVDYVAACESFGDPNAEEPDWREVPVDDPDLIGASGSFTRAWAPINALSVAYQQRQDLETRGFEPMRHAPYGGESANAVVTQWLGLRRDGRLLPLPDDVAVPLLNAAIRLIGTPANDVIHLSRLHHDVRSIEESGQARLTAYEQYGVRLRAFQFATAKGEKEPWHEQLLGIERHDRRGQRTFLKTSQRVRQLILDLQTACAVVIQGLTGIRSHELLGAEIDRRSEGALPSCIEVGTNDRGDIELFYFIGRTLKGAKREAKWLLGSRLVGSGYEPPAVRAFCVMAALFEPWRELSGRRSVFLSFSCRQGLPRQAKSVGPMLNGLLSNSMKDFLARVDMSRASPESQLEFANGQGLRPHRFRPTFARFMFQVNKELLPAISEHFKHMSYEVVRGAYIGRDESMLNACDSALTQTSSEVLLRLTAPNAVVAGGASVAMASMFAELRDLIDRSEGRSFEEKALSVVESRELHVYPAAYGSCLASFKPMLSKCNEKAGRAGWQSPFPHETYRTLSTCLGCECLALSSEEKEFFVARLERYSTLAAEAAANGDSGLAGVCNRRAKQAAVIVAKLDRSNTAGGQCR